MANQPVDDDCELTEGATRFTQQEINTITAFAEAFDFGTPTLEEEHVLCFDDLTIEKTAERGLT